MLLLPLDFAPFVAGDKKITLGGMYVDVYAHVVMRMYVPILLLPLDFAPFLADDVNFTLDP